VDGSQQVSETRWIWPQGSFWDRTKVDLDFFDLVSFDSEEFRVPGTAAILGFAIVEDEGFVACFKQLLNAVGRGLLAMGPAPFEIGFTVRHSRMDWQKYLRTRSELDISCLQWSQIADVNDNDRAA
jgi:hypothetical protein